MTGAAAEAMMRTQLYYGVTTARSIGTDNAEQVELMLEANAGLPDTPRMFTAGRGFTHPGGFNAGTQPPASEEETREIVRALAGQGVHFVRMWVNEMPEPGLKITPQMRTAIVEEANANGLVPVAHIDEEADGRQLIEAGMGDFLHSTVLTFGPGSGAPVDDPEPSAKFIQMCLDNNISFTPTLLIVQNNWHFAEHAEQLHDPDLREAMNTQAMERWSDPEARAEVVEADNFEDRKAAFRQLQDFVKTMHDADVRIAIRTDSGTANVPMGWGHPPRAGALRAGRADPDAGHRGRHRYQRQRDAAGGKGGVPVAGGGEDRGPDGDGCGSAGGYSEHACDRAGDEGWGVGGAGKVVAGAVEVRLVQSCDKMFAAVCHEHTRTFTVGVNVGGLRATWIRWLPSELAGPAETVLRSASVPT